MIAHMAACCACPVLVAAATRKQLDPLMDEHTERTGHREWAVSVMEHARSSR